MIKKYLNVIGYKSIDKEAHTVEVVISDESQDRDGEVIALDAWDFENFFKNPVLIDSHKYNGISNIIGKVLNIHINTESKQLIAKLQYFVNEGNPIADYAWTLVMNGLASYSVGFIPIEKKNNVWTRVELLEISQVTVPANPNATVIRDSLVEAMIKAYKEIEKKAVVGYSKADWLPDDTPWDADRARRDALEYAGGKDKFDPKKYREFFLWYDKEKEDNLTAYKLPFRYLVSGKPKNVWRGIVSAMASILGARGGVDIPEKERREVYDVLVRYYKEHGNEPPEFKEYQDELEIYRVCGYKKISELPVYEDFLRDFIDFLIKDKKEEV